jgi:hypothetical protein
MICSAIFTWQPVASMVTMQRYKCSNSNKRGMAVTSLDFASAASCHNTTRLAVAKALTMCNAPSPLLRS